MSGNENIILKLHKVYPEYVYSSVQFEIDIHTNRIISQESLSVSDNNLIERIDWEDYLEEQPKLCLKHIINEDLDEPTITLIKFEGDKTTETHINETINRSSEEPYIFDSSIKKQNIQLKLPDAAIISCQNCDTAFPTKYQYQRHQCEFNASKVVLKPEIVGKDIDKATRLRFECDTCKKTFVSNNNLERHRNCHMNIKSNVCEHCKKTFVSENRLKIHKENHCKKAGDTTKFYRSDVVVWHCENCKQVFATQQCGEKHISDCAVIQQETKTELESNESISTEDKSETKNDSVNMTNDNNVDSKSEIVNQIESENKNQQNNTDKSTEIPKLSKVVTEILYQCEFCNQTFITKSTLLSHQGSHTTEKNYECTFCEKYFNSYTVAVTHWQNKCTEESNLFYLPKMIYCEHCDRGFKSHELLYSHKNKKKHFTPKIHEKKINENISSTNENAIVKLIENMITKMDKMVTEGNDETENKNEENKENDENGKKKRGRRRKWEKMDLKNKKRSDMIDGYMYQCERCSVVFKDISALEAHKNTQHVSIYSCGQCGQVRFSVFISILHQIILGGTNFFDPGPSICFITTLLKIKSFNSFPIGSS